MTTTRTTPLATWGKALEQDLATVGSSKRELARVLGLDYSSLFRWLRKPATPSRRHRVDAALAQIRSYRSGPTAHGVGATEQTVRGYLDGLRAMRARIDAAIAALEEVEHRG